MSHKRKIIGNALDFTGKFHHVEELKEEGSYRGKIIGFKETDTNIIVKIQLSGLNEEVNYESVNAFLRKEYADDLTVESFLETFGEPDDWNALIGQECIVYVERNESSSGKLFYNAVEFEKIE